MQAIFAQAASGLSVPELLAIMVPTVGALVSALVYIVRSKDDALTKQATEHRIEREAWDARDKIKDERFERFVSNQAEVFERWRESVGGLFSHTARAAEAAQQAVELMSQASHPTPSPDRRSSDDLSPPTRRRNSRA